MWQTSCVFIAFSLRSIKRKVRWPVEVVLEHVGEGNVLSVEPGKAVSKEMQARHRFLVIHVEKQDHQLELLLARNGIVEPAGLFVPGRVRPPREVFLCIAEFQLPEFLLQFADGFDVDAGECRYDLLLASCGDVMLQVILIRLKYRAC